MTIERDRVDRAAAVMGHVLMRFVAARVDNLTVEAAIALAFHIVDSVPWTSFVARGSQALN